MRCKKTKAPVYVNKWKMGHRWIIIVRHYNKVSLLLYLTNWIYIWNYFILRWGKKGDFDYRSTQNKIILYSVPKWIIFVHIFYSNSCWFSTFSKILLTSHPWPPRGDINECFFFLQKHVILSLINFLLFPKWH